MEPETPKQMQEKKAACRTLPRCTCLIILAVVATLVMGAAVVCVYVTVLAPDSHASAAVGFVTQSPAVTKRPLAKEENPTTWMPMTTSAPSIDSDERPQTTGAIRGSTTQTRERTTTTPTTTESETTEAPTRTATPLPTNWDPPAPATTRTTAAATTTTAMAGATNAGSDQTTSTTEGARHNVLLFLVDDLRPEFHDAYNQTELITPTVDKLTQSATVFQRAYCQQAICGPARGSMLTGRRPQRTKAWNFLDSFRDALPTIDTLPGYFKKHGYTTMAAGKTFHVNLPPKSDGLQSWSEFPDDYSLIEDSCSSDEFTTGVVPSLVCPDNSRNLTDFQDYRNYLNVKEKLASLAAEARQEGGNPFFLVFGILKPHLPFRFPVEFGGRNIWEAYGPLENIKLPKLRTLPTYMPALALTYSFDGETNICVYEECHNVPGKDIGCPFCGDALPDNATRLLRKAYYAEVSWVDHLIGLTLDELEASGVANDTIVAIVGDHGWELGESQLWGKGTNFELATRVPFIVKDAGQTAPQQVSTLVETVDLYPTLVSLAGLPAATGLDGTDLSPMLNSRSTEQEDTVDPAQVKPVNAAFTEFPRCGTLDEPWTDVTSCVNFERSTFQFMGLSIRTDEWRCTHWMYWDGDALQPDFSRDPAAVEFYKHVDGDDFKFDAYETANLAEFQKARVHECFDMAVAHWNTTSSAFSSTTARSMLLPATATPPSQTSSVNSMVT